MSTHDWLYYQRRADIEAERAKTASVESAARVHHQLAEAYREKLAALEVRARLRP